MENNFMEFCDKINIGLRYLKNEGLLTTIDLCITLIIGIIFNNKMAYIYKLDLSKLKHDIIKNDFNKQLKQLTVNEIPDIIDIMYLSESEIMDRLKQGQKCFVVYHMNILSGYLWTTTQAEYNSEIEYMFSVPNNCIYIHGVRITKKSRRGKLDQYLLLNTCKELHKGGYDSAYSIVLTDNIASQKTFEKCDFFKSKKIKFWKFFSRKTHYIV